ncbi:MAG: CotH kinase family protein [Verrucomicrobiota bacterium]
MLRYGILGIVCLWLGLDSVHAQIEISEFVARNIASLADNDRAFSDWIELHNTTDQDVNLEGWYLTDTATNLTRWRFPSLVLASNDYVVVFASGKNRTAVTAYLHTNFKLPASGGYLALVKPDGQTLATEFGPAYPPQTSDVSCGPDPTHPGPPYLFFERPTPRFANVPGWPSVAGPVAVSRPGGPFLEPFTLELSSGGSTEGIWYSLDGSIPTTNSFAYTGPLTIDHSVAVRARVIRDGQVPGPVTGAFYSQISAAQSTFSSNLPLLLVDTLGRAIQEGSRTPCYFTVIDPGQDRASWTRAPSLQSRGGIEVRGSSSTQFPKKSYGLELVSEDNADRHLPILGLPEESDWVLYAPYTDKTLIRDVLAYQLSNEIGRYAPRTRLVEVYVNRTGTIDNSDYQGVYVLVEKLKGGPDRVDIPQVESTDVREPEVTGGYILKKDRLDGNDSSFTTPHGQELGLEWPHARELSTNQTLWIRGFINRFESALYGARYRDPVNGYAAFIDPDAFIDHHWLVEVAKNIDGYRLSTFMHKDRGGRLRMGPIWDYNLSFGNANYNDGQNPSGWYASQVGGTDYLWYGRLFQDADYTQRHYDRWPSLRTNVLTTEHVLSLVDGYTNLLAEAQERNFKKWRILGQYVWPNAFIGSTYGEEIGFLKDWITGRLAWIDSSMLRWPAVSHPSGYYPGGVTVTLTAQTDIFYTLDGTDPRSPGGAVSFRAKRYTGPIGIGANAKLIARARSGTRWSPKGEGSYAITIPDLRISEIMYHPPAAPPGSPFGDEEFEFLELRNVGTETLPLGRVKLSGGISYEFPPDAGELWPGENLVLARNLDAFASRYGSGVRVVGPYAGHLANSGDHLVLTGPLGEPILDFNYDDAWQPATDGRGYSLTIRRPAAPSSEWNRSDAWDRSVIGGGTPGRDDVPESDPGHVSLHWSTGDGGSVVRLQFEIPSGQTCSIQSASGLSGYSWQTLTNLPPPTSGGPLQVDLSVDADNSRIYRVVVPRSF